MKNWIPLLLLAGAVAGDAGDNPGQDPIKQAREQAIEQDTISHARVFTAYFYAGTNQTGTFAVIPTRKGTFAGLTSADDKNRLALAFRNGEPSIIAVKDKQVVTIPLFALAEHLGIQPEERVVGAEPAKGDEENWTIASSASHESTVNEALRAIDLCVGHGDRNRCTQRGGLLWACCLSAAHVKQTG